MQWRALVLLLTGLIVIYLVSLLQETPYPHPARLYIPPLSQRLSSPAVTSTITADAPSSTSTTTTTKRLLKQPPDTTVLTISDTHVYHTSLWFELFPPNQSLRLGSRSFKNGGLGYLLQQRQELSVYYTNTTDPSIGTTNGTTVSGWETTHEHVFNGPISQLSSLNNGVGNGKEESSSTGLQFAVLYHILDDEDLQHWARVFYFPTKTDLDDDSTVSAGLEYKDALLPGSTWISFFSLEPSAILYSRDPDAYRFRWARLPDNLTAGPHSGKADLIVLSHSEYGDRTYLYDQPDDIEEHAGLLSGMYSPIPGTKQVFTLNAYKTYWNFHVKGVMAENATTNSIDPWTGRNIIGEDYDVITHETLEYMAIVDGVHIQQERIKLEMPELHLSRSKDAKVLVMSSIKYPLHSLVYMDDELGLVLQQNGNEKGNIWIKDQVDMDDMDGDLMGLQLDSTGHYLAAWTNKDQLFIFCRRQLHRRSLQHQQQQRQQHDHQQQYQYEPQEQQRMPVKEDDRDLVLDEDRLERWMLSMVITSDQGELTDKISAAAFITTKVSNFILVGMKNGAVHSYSLDKAEPQKPINFWSFMIEQWHIWLPMSIVIFFFVASENQQASRIDNVQH